MRFRTYALVCLCVSLVASSVADSIITLGVKSPKPKERAARLVKGLGRIVSRDPVSGAFHVRLRSGISVSGAVKSLCKKRGVVFARPSDPFADPTKTDFGRVDSLEHLITELKARNKDRELMAEAFGKPFKRTDEIETDYYEAWLFWLQERAFPGKTIDAEAYRIGARHRDEMEPAFGGRDRLGGAWQFVGPRNLDIPYRTYYGIRPINGRVGAITADPSNPNTLYVGGANGGVWKSTDGGVNWIPLTDFWPSITVSSIAVDPANPLNIYVGTGDYHGSRIQSQGIMKSTDGGQSWTNYGNAQFGNRAISAILIDPENSQIITITTGRSSGGAGFVWRSVNGGITWNSVSPVTANWCNASIGALDGKGQRAYYVSGSGNPGGNVWKSMDRGATWTQLVTPASAGSHSVISVAASPNFPGTVYIVVNADQRIYKSTGYGASWSDITAGFPNGPNNYFWSQSTYNWFLAVTSRPGPQDVIYTGMIDAVQSPDGGTTWQSIGGPTYVSGSVLHNDQQCVSVDRTNPNVVYVGNDGGAYRYAFDPGTGTGSWSYLSANLGVSMFYKFDLHPTDPAWIIGGTQDNATPVSVGDLANWENCGGGDGGFGAINPANPNVQYSEAQGLYVYRTGNAWASSNVIAPSTGTDRVAFIAPFVLDPNNPDLLYAGTNYVWRRNDTTGIWEPRLGGISLSTGTVRYIAVAPGDANRIYTSASDGQVWMSQDAGLTWTQINAGTVSLPVRTINYITVNPGNKNDILVTCSGTGTGHLWRCADTTSASRTWINLSGSGVTGLPNIAANTICRDIFDFEGTFYVGTDLGLFVSEDGGGAWANATAPLGLPNVQVNDIKMHRATDTVYAATYGRGIWKMALAPIVYPTSATVTIGSYVGGGVAELRNSDDRRFRMLGDEITPRVEVEITATSPIENPSELDFFLEAACGRTRMVQLLWLYNYTTSSWDLINARPSTVADSRFIRKIIGAAGAYVQPTTREMKARVRWTPPADTPAATDGWPNTIDRAVWRVVP